MAIYGKYKREAAGMGYEGQLLIPLIVCILNRVIVVHFQKCPERQLRILLPVFYKMRYQYGYFQELGSLSRRDQVNKKHTYSDPPAHRPKV